MIDTSNPDGISVGSVHGQCACDLLAAQTKADALAKRVEELETLLDEWWKRKFSDSRPLLAIETEAKKIFERRAGRAK